MAKVVENGDSDLKKQLGKVTEEREKAKKLAASVLRDKGDLMTKLETLQSEHDETIQQVTALKAELEKSSAADTDQAKRLVDMETLLATEKETVQQLEKELAASKAEAEDVKSSFDALTKELETLKKELGQARVIVAKHDELQRDYESTNAELQSIKIELERSRGYESERSTKIAALETSLKESQEKVKQLQEDSTRKLEEAAAAARKQLDDKNAELESVHKLLETEAAAARSKAEEMTTELAREQSNTSTVSVELAQVKGAYSAANSELDNIRTKTAQDEQVITEQKAKIDNFIATAAALQEEIQRLQVASTAAKAQYSSRIEELETVIDQRSADQGKMLEGVGIGATVTAVAMLLFRVLSKGGK